MKEVETTWTTFSRSLLVCYEGSMGSRESILRQERPEEIDEDEGT